MIQKETASHGLRLWLAYHIGGFYGTLVGMFITWLFFKVLIHAVCGTMPE